MRDNEWSGQKIEDALDGSRPDVLGEDETMRLFQGQTVSGFIQKPYTSSRLAEAVKDAIG